MLVTLINPYQTIALYIAQRPAASTARLAALPQCSRRDYSKPRRPQARDWWEVVVPDMRINDRPVVVDEIVKLAGST